MKNFVQTLISRKNIQISFFFFRNPWPRSNHHHNSSHHPQRNGDFGFVHDPMTAIGFEDQHHQSSLSGLPIPVGMFLNMSQIPPRFYNQQYPGGNPQNKKSHYRGSSGPMSQEHVGSASQVSLNF